MTLYSEYNLQDIIRRILKPLTILVLSDNKSALNRFWRDQPIGLQGSAGILLGLMILDEEKIQNDVKPFAIIKYLLNGLKPEHIIKHHNTDLLGGIAGLIGPLLQIDDIKALEFATLAADQLIERIDADGAIDASNSHLGFIGYSHGSCGVLASMINVFKRTKDDRYLSSARNVLNYDRSFYDKEQNKWADLNLLTPQNKNQTNFTFPTRETWCHGAPGLLLSRAALWNTDLWDDTTSKEVDSGLLATASLTPTGLHHLCCGSLGNASITQLILDGPWNIPDQTREICSKVIFNAFNHAIELSQNLPIDLICYESKNENFEFPGFFMGISGMGYSLINDKFSKKNMARIMSSDNVTHQM